MFSTGSAGLAPNNIVVNQLFGYSSGLGMGFFTFDWAMISYVGSPLVIPVSNRLSIPFYQHQLNHLFTVVGSSQYFRRIRLHVSGFCHRFFTVSDIHAHPDQAILTTNQTKNVFFSKFLPMSTSTPFDNTGATYNPRLVILNGTFTRRRTRPIHQFTSRSRSLSTSWLPLPQSPQSSFHTWCKSPC